MDTFLGLPGSFTVTTALLGLQASSPGPSGALSPPFPPEWLPMLGSLLTPIPHSSLQLTPITQSSSIMHPLFTIHKRSRGLTGKWGETPALGLCP